MHAPFHDPLKRLHLGLTQTEHFYMVFLAVVIGFLGGGCAVAFRKLIELGQLLFWRGDGFSLDYVRGLPAWWIILVPATGGLVVGLIIHFFAREAKGHGVPEVMEAVTLRGGRIRPRVVIAKLAASAVCIASGGSVGREGPIVQIGASLGSTIGQMLGVGERRLRTLVGCGAAAGIAGTFNAPVAGALFAVEVILGDFGVTQFSPVVLSSVCATVVSHYYLGNTPAFTIPAYHLVNASELVVYGLLGILVGLAAIAFTRTLYGAEDLFDKIPITGPVKAVIGGLLIGAMGLHFPEVFGVGYEAIDVALHDGMVWHVLLILALLKILAVSVTIGSGGSGGIFAPSLFIGAMLGGAVGTLVHGIWPGATGSAGAYALVGMGGLVAAATHAPITAIVIIFELTGDYRIILPLMVTCITATLLATQLQKASIYTMKLIRRGIDLHAGRSLNVLRHIHVKDVMRQEFASVPVDEPLMHLVSRYIESPSESVFVTDDEGRFLGAITINEIRPIMADLGSLKDLITARDLRQTGDIPMFTPADRLDTVMHRFGTYRFEAPVVEGGRIVGSIWPEDVIRRYSAELFKREMASGMSMALSSGAPSEQIPGVGGMVMVEIPAPRRFIGRSVAELDVRREFGVSILLIKQKSGVREEIADHLPDAGYVFQEGDVILVMGSEEKVRALERSL